MDAVLERSIGVRRYGPDDESFVAALAGEAFAPFTNRAREVTLEMLREARALTLVATRGGERIGFVVIEHRGRSGASIQAIAVAPHERCRGIGQRLMVGALHAARAAGVVELRLCTAQANLEALELFIKLGFRIVSRTPGFYPSGQDACTLARRL